MSESHTNPVSPKTAGTTLATTPPIDGAQTGAGTSAIRRVLIFVFLAWVLDASDSTIYSLTIPQIRTEFGLSLTTMGVIASIFLAGTVIGAALLPVLAERKGRRIGMVTCISLFSVFTGLIGIVHNAWLLAVARFLTGCGTGAEWPIGAAYLSEMVSAKRRGTAMGVMQAGYPVGFFAAAGLFAAFSQLGFGWRACYLALLLPAVICLPIGMWLKESPAWQARHAQPAGQPRSVKPDVRMRELLAPRYRRYTLISLGLHIFGAIFGYGLLVWLPSAVSIDFHLSKVQTAQFVMLSWGLGTFGYLAAGPLADRLGRRPVLAAYTLLGTVSVVWLNYLHFRHAAGFAQVAVPGVLIGISLGVSGIYITYTSEIFPASLRTVGLGFSVAAGKVTATFVPALLGWIAQFSSITTALLISTAIGFLMLPVVFFGPETARRQLDEIVN